MQTSNSPGSPLPSARPTPAKAGRLTAAARTDFLATTISLVSVTVPSGGFLSPGCVCAFCPHAPSLGVRWLCREEGCGPASQQEQRSRCALQVCPLASICFQSLLLKRGLRLLRIEEFGSCLALT